MSTTKEGFGSRWSRLKRETDEAKPVDAEAIPSESEGNPGTDAAISGKDDAELTDLELLEKYALPDPDGMKAGDDFSAFMKQAVPDRLRRRALRVLWGSNPILANLDELVDYGEDYTDAATVVENMQTIYQVGKGSAWKFQEEQARIAAEKAAREAEEAERRAHNGEEEEAEDTEATEGVEALPEPEKEDEAISTAEDVHPEELLVVEATHDDPAPLPKRPAPMRFHFD